jgi:hypothetical protein
MRILANENMPLASVQLLRAAGFDVKAVGIDMPGITNRRIEIVAVMHLHRMPGYWKDRAAI